MPHATLWIIFSTALFIGFSGALIPGPFLSLNISQTYQYGFWAGPLMVLGHAVAELAMIGLLAAGLSRFLKNKWLNVGVGAVGGLFLIWMAVGIIQTSAAVSYSMSSGQTPPGMPHPVWAGFLASVLNPAWVIWWASLGSAYVVWSAKLGLTGLAFFFVGHILSDATWYSLVSFIVVTGKKWLSSTVFQVVLIIIAIFLVIIAGYFIFNALRTARKIKPGISHFIY